MEFYESLSLWKCDLCDRILRIIVALKMRFMRNGILRIIGALKMWFMCHRILRIIVALKMRFLRNRILRTSSGICENCDQIIVIQALVGGICEYCDQIFVIQVLFVDIVTITTNLCNSKVLLHNSHCRHALALEFQNLCCTTFPTRAWISNICHIGYNAGDYRLNFKTFAA